MSDRESQPAPAAAQPEETAAVEANVVESRAPASESPTEQPVPANVWAYGRHDRQVALAGALVDDPSLRGTSLTPDEWRKRVDAYLAKPA